MAVVYLLSAAEFKLYTPVHGNVDDKFIEQAILTCQDLYVEEITGTVLYNFLKSEVASLGTNYKNLLQNYLHKGMKYWIMAELTQILSYRMVNIGIQEKYSEASNSADKEAVTKYFNNLMNKAEFYANKTRKYLCANTTLFPEYEENGDNDDDVLPKKNLFKSSIYLGENTNNCCDE